MTVKIEKVLSALSILSLDMSYQVSKSSMKICVAKVVVYARSIPHAVIVLMTVKGAGATSAIFVHCRDRITCTC